MFFNIFGICVGTLLYLYWLTLCEHVNIMHENHDLAIARSSSSRADPGLRVAFKCLNV